MMKSGLASVILTIGVVYFAPVQSQCLPGLAVFNRTNHMVLSVGECQQTIDIKALADPPIVTFTRAHNNETYILMLLESTRNPDIFILHWLISEMKAIGNTLQTHQLGARDLLSGYISPVNQTQYEFRLYNMTGKMVWEPVGNAERLDFFPSQWLAKNRVYTAPIAKTVFSVKDPIPGPPGWVVPHHPIVPPQQPGQYPPQQPGQYPPQHPGQYPPQQPGQYPPQQPSHYPHIPPSHPTGGNQPPSTPVGGHPLVQPPPQNLPQYPTNNQNRHDYNINGTWYFIQTPGKPNRMSLNINSTIYSTDTYNKYFQLTPYLVINNKTYIWRNMTRVPGQGQSIFINGTLYVPYSPNPNEIHHFHHKGKSAASSLISSTILICITPLLFHVLST